jgi:hypothetical protein
MSKVPLQRDTEAAACPALDRLPETKSMPSAATKRTEDTRPDLGGDVLRSAPVDALCVDLLQSIRVNTKPEK